MDGAGQNSFNMQALIWMKNGTLKLVFASAVFHKSPILLIFEAQFTKSVLNILLYPESTLVPTVVGPEEKSSK